MPNIFLLPVIIKSDAWSLIKEALNRCDNHSKKCLNDYMRNAAGVDGIVDSFLMQDGNILRPMYINKIKNAKMKVKVY